MQFPVKPDVGDPRRPLPERGEGGGREATIRLNFTRPLMTNPLLDLQDLPPFSSIRAEHVEPAIRDVLAENRAELEQLLSAGEHTWDSLVVPLEEMQHRLARTWSPVGHLNGVLNSDELRAAYNACLPLLTAWQTDLAQNE